MDHRLTRTEALHLLNETLDDCTMAMGLPDHEIQLLTDWMKQVRTMANNPPVLWHGQYCTTAGDWRTIKSFVNEYECRAWVEAQTSIVHKRCIRD